MQFCRVVIFGDTFGVLQILKYVNRKNVMAIVGASIRRQYWQELRRIANSLDVPFIVQPKFESSEYESFKSELILLNPDILLCNSYSMIIREDIRQIFNHNCINIHHSLLPKNRGPNPYQWALINNEEKTGITIHYMDNGIDTGDIITQEEILIAISDSWIDVKNKCVSASEVLLANEMPNILNGSNARQKQNDNESSTNFRLTKEFPRIDFDKMNNMDIYNLIRAQIAPLGGAYIITSAGRMYFDSVVPIGMIEQLRGKYAR